MRDLATVPAFVLGVDPGAATGLAGYDPDADALVFVGSADPLDALRYVGRWARARTAGGSPVLLGAYVEDARGLPIFDRNRHAERGERDRIARSVGRIDLLTDLYLGLFRSLGVPAAAVEPPRRKKWDAHRLRVETGYDRQTNEHGRDAARLVWQKPVPLPTVSEPAPSPRPALAAGAARSVRRQPA